jgi:hypothetical protein
MVEASTECSATLRTQRFLPSQMPLMDLKNFQFSLEDRDYSKIN